MKVQIKNYQSIADISFVTQGFTVIIGASNVGKSATLKAMGAAMFHRLGNDFVRQGQDYATVVLDDVVGTDGELHRIEWRKGKAKNQYVIDGSVFDSIGRAVPEDISAFGIGDVDTTTGSVRLQYQTQHEEPFMLFDPQKAMSVVSASSKIAVVQQAANLADTDERGVKRERGIRARDVEEAEVKLAEFAYVEDFEDFGVLHAQLVEYVRDQEAEVRELREALHALEEAIDRRSEVRYALEFATDVTAYAGVKLGEVLEVQVTTESLGALGAQLKDARGMVYSLERVPELGRIGDVVESCTQQLAEYTSSQRLIGDLKTSVFEKQQAASRVREVDEKKESAVLELVELVKENPQCPLCGSDMTVEEVLHEHGR